MILPNGYSGMNAQQIFTWFGIEIPAKVILDAFDGETKAVRKRLFIRVWIMQAEQDFENVDTREEMQKAIRRWNQLNKGSK